MKINLIKKQMLVVSAIMICLSSLTSCAGIEKNNNKNFVVSTGLAIGLGCAAGGATIISGWLGHRIACNAWLIPDNKDNIAAWQEKWSELEED